MTTYKNIKGIEIKYLSADPPAPTVGQVWYNTNQKVVKGAINGAGTWASGGNLNTARQEMGGAGTQASALGYGGNTADALSALTEAWNGSSWSEVNDMATARRHATTGNGSAVNAIQAGGETDAVVVNTEEWTVPAPVQNLVMSD